MQPFPSSGVIKAYFHQRPRTTSTWRAQPGDRGRAPKRWRSVRVSLAVRPRSGAEGEVQTPHDRILGVRQAVGLGEQLTHRLGGRRSTTPPSSDETVFPTLARLGLARAFSPRDLRVAAFFRLKWPHSKSETCTSGSVPRKRKCGVRAVKVVVLLEGRSREVSSRSLCLLSASPVKGGSAGTDERDEHHVCRHAAHRFYLRVHRAARRG